MVEARSKVIQTVRERFSCRQCEAITQPPAPFHVTPRGFAGPSLLAMILFEKFGQHQPLNRQSERYAREGVELSLSTLADQVGACAVALRPLHALIEAHVLAATRLHGDDTTVPILAKGQTETGRVWVYVRDDRPLHGVALLTMVGGLSAATGMVVVESVALAITISNDLVMPLLLRRSAQAPAAEGDIGELVLWVRRIAIVGVLALGFACERMAAKRASCLLASCRSRRWRRSRPPFLAGFSGVAGLRGARSQV